MKILFLVLIISFSQIVIKSQTLPEWFRVYTFDDSIVELNTNYVMFSNRKTERVRFRWTYTKPQKLDSNSQLRYKSILQEITFDCSNKKYSIYDIQLYDADGKKLPVESKPKTEEWQEVKFGKMIGKLFTPACKLIDLRKREPTLEP